MTLVFYQPIFNLEIPNDFYTSNWDTLETFSYSFDAKTIYTKENFFWFYGNQIIFKMVKLHCPIRKRQQL